MDARVIDSARWREAVAPDAEERVLEAVETLAGFPVLDGTVQRIIAVADDPDTTTADLVAVLEADPTFAANLLRYANSAAMARPIRAKTVRQAVMLVGRKALRRLALEAATYRFFEKAPGTGSARGELHVHAISVAAVAAAAAEQVRAHGDGPHLGGLLHDIGRYVLPIAFTEEACDDIAKIAPSGPDRVLLERERFGIDHALAGALLAERWGVSPDVAAAIAWHHGGPTGVGSPNAEVACVQVGNEVVHMVAGREPDHVLLEVALEQAGLPATALDALAEHTLPTSSRPALEEPGSLARRITETERLSQTDELTGVDNRRHWLHATRAALGEPGGENGAVVLCDVDELADINQAYGHRTGDVVLTEVARILAGHGRPGRLAGDLFAVWVREGRDAATDAAARIADEVRVAFSERDGAPDVTVTLGLATVAAHGSDLAGVLEAADVALRVAKDAGSNGTGAAFEPFSSPVPPVAATS
jgi:diguanylate cyclase (GGDEF)-like protein/putative nucleotidyltransferase with HDIG domain